MTALVVPESATFVLRGIDTRLSMTEVDPVLPARSVATTSTVLSPPVRSYTVLDQVPDPRVAVSQFTITLATHPVSVTLPERVGNPVTISLFTCDVIVTIGATVSPLLVPPVLVVPLAVMNESVLDTLFGFPAASENTPVHTDTIIVPVDPDGVTVIAYQVELLLTKLLVNQPVTEISANTRSAVSSDVVIPTEIAHVMVPLAVEESIAPGGVISSCPVSVIPDATT